MLPAGVLPPQHLGALAARRRRRARLRRGRVPRRPLPARAGGDAAGAGRDRAGSVLRADRPDPRLRPLAGDRALRLAPRGGRRRRQHDRDDVPARADPGRADAQPLAAAARAIHGREPGAFARGPDHRPVRQRGRQAGPAPAPALVARGRRADGRPARQRAAALRRGAERDDRPTDGARLRAEQPHPERRPGAGGVRRRDRLRPAGAVHGHARAGRHHRRPDRAARDRAPAGDLRPRPAHPRLDPRARHAAPRAARLDATPPAAQGPSR